MNKNIIEVLRGQCRYHANFMVVWFLFTCVSVYFGYAILSAIGGAFTWRHGNKCYGAYKTACLLSDSTVIKVNGDESEINISGLIRKAEDEENGRNDS